MKLLVNLLPCASINYSIYGTRVHSHISGDGCLAFSGFTAFSYISNLLIGQLRRIMPLSLSASSLPISIGNIFNLRSLKQMARIKTKRIVTGRAVMKRAKQIIEIRVRQLVGDPMGEAQRPLKSYLTIAFMIFTKWPNLALFSFNFKGFDQPLQAGLSSIRILIRHFGSPKTEVSGPGRYSVSALHILTQSEGAMLIS